MTALIGATLTRLRPASGWSQPLLALCAALWPALAAGDTTLNLPAELFAIAGLAGLVAGGLAFPGNWQRMRIVSALVGMTVVAALLVLSAGQALPPFALIGRDLVALDAWFRGPRDGTAIPESGTALFLGASLERLWVALQNAPTNGEAGAQLLTRIFGLLATLISVAILASALVRGREVFGWGLPLLALLTTFTIVGGGRGWPVISGMVLLLCLAALAHFQTAERHWQRTGIDYSDQLRPELLAWAAGLFTVVIVFAWLIPTPVSNPLADMIWRNVELPSGIAVLSRPPARVPKAQIALSTLPAVQLGVSLEEQPPDTLALRLRLNAPLPTSPWPYYWRARVLNIYTSRAWTSNARVGTPVSMFNGEAVAPGQIVQEIEDVRRDRHVLIGLPNTIALDVAADAEQLGDATTSALTTEAEPTRYRVLSRPVGAATALPPAQPLPDHRDTLSLPSTVPPRVGDLARAIAGKATTPEAQALALETYLRELPYAYQVEPIRAGTDAVDQFLFEMREGYCTYYASAMAVMARSLGIPARVAIGYATGEVGTDGQSYTVRERDAHAWPELFLGGRWVPYEPTPIRQLPARSAAVSPEPVDTAAPVAPPEPVELPWLWFAVGALLLMLAGSAVYWRSRRVSPVDALLAELAGIGMQAGVAWPQGLTLREYVAALTARMPNDTHAFHELATQIERACYSQAHTFDLDRAQARATVRRLHKAARRTRYRTPQ